MIIRVNGERVDQSGIVIKLNNKIVPFKEVAADPPEVVESVYSWSKIPLKWKMVAAAAAATLVMDVMFSGGVTTLAATKTVTAAGGFDIGMVKAAVDPIKEFLIALADPICYVMFVWGCIECIVGRAASGLNRIKYAALGFVAINWIPMVMEIIRAAGAAGRGI